MSDHDSNSDNNGNQSDVVTHNKSMSSGGNILTKKVGPLPVYGWVAVIVVSYLLYNHFRNAGASSSSTPSTDTSNAPLATNGASSNGGNTDTTSSTGVAAGADNTQWLAAANAALRKQGYSQSVIDTAFQHYFGDQHLTSQDAHVMNSAINIVGHPPVAGAFGSYHKGN